MMKSLTFLLMVFPLSLFATITQTQLNTLIKQYRINHQNDLHFTAIEASVLLPNHQVINAAAGKQSRNGKTAEPGMMVQYGSITKGFTASLILRLINANQLHFNTQLEDIFPERFTPHATTPWPQAWRSVTVLDLLHMTSGIPVYLNSPNTFPNLNMKKAYNLSDLANIAAQYQRLHGCLSQMNCFKPHTRYGYSNTNYIILGMIIERLSHHSFAAQMQQHILSKQSDDVIYDLVYPANISANMIHGYMETTALGKNNTLLFGSDTNQTPLYTAASAGGLSGTTAGLTQLIYALFHNRFAPTQQLTNQHYLVQTAKGHRGQPVTDIKTQCQKVCYGLGLGLIYQKPFGKIWVYEGGTFGFLTYYYWIPKTDTVIAVSQNSSADGTNLKPLIMSIATKRY